MRALVTGATGFIGSRLLARLDHPVVLTRNVERAREEISGVTLHRWDPMQEPAPPTAFDGIEAVIHLAGEPVVDGRWTKKKKARVRDSRVIGTRNLVTALAGLAEKPRVLVSASAVGFYGSKGDTKFDESAQPGDDFLANVCVDWEEEARKAQAAGIRVVTPRIGIVLGQEGGALAKMLLPFKMCVGGRLGNGRQWMPWIHVDDLVSMIMFAAERDELSGAMNGSAPNPVTNREFTKTLGRVLRRPTILPMPAFMLRLGVGEFANVLLMSQRAIPQAALDAGFSFQYPELEDALREILKS